MWDNPRQLNLAANALIALAALLFAYAALQLLLRSPLFPLREIVVLGELKHADREEIANAADGLGGNFFAADLGAVRARLEQVSWVRRVDARRVWPDRIEVQLQEHQAFARWGDAGYVNVQGEPFAARMDAAEQAKLPLFAGPAGTEGEVTRRYRRFAELVAPLGSPKAPATIAAVLLSPRYAWQLRLAGGLQLELGRDGAEPVEQRLERFVAAYPESIGRLAGARQARNVDLRYPNGFALRVAGLKG
jgi:cell division protein FtsQ